MVALRPLILVTGTLHVRGGERSKVRNEDTTKNGASTQVVVTRTVSRDRKAANVIVTDYMRRLRHLAALRTPYGTLVDVERLDDLKKLLLLVSKRITDYSSDERKTRISNCVLWERLSGQRASAVAGWIDAELAYGSADVKDALGQLTKN